MSARATSGAFFPRALNSPASSERRLPHSVTISGRKHKCTAQAQWRHVTASLSEGSRQNRSTSRENLPNELRDLSNLVKKLAEETAARPSTAEVSKFKVAFGGMADDMKKKINATTTTASASTSDVPGVHGLPASVVRQMPWLNQPKKAPQQTESESDLEGLLPRAATAPMRTSTNTDRSLVPRTEVIAIRSRLNKKLSESNTYNRFLQREVQYREDALTESKALLLALTSEMKELSEAAEEVCRTDGLPITRKINGRYLPSHLSTRLQGLYVDLRAQLDGIEKLRLKEVPLVWFGMAEDVKVMGTFDGWTYGEQMSPETTGTMTRFTTVLKLRPGRYEVKFLVDGEWRVAPEWPSIGHGMTENNVLVVE